MLHNFYAIVQITIMIESFLCLLLFIYLDNPVLNDLIFDFFLQLRMSTPWLSTVENKDEMVEKIKLAKRYNSDNIIKNFLTTMTVFFKSMLFNILMYKLVIFIAIGSIFSFIEV